MQTKELVDTYISILVNDPPLFIPPWHYSYKRNERVSNKLGGGGGGRGCQLEGSWNKVSLQQTLS